MLGLNIVKTEQESRRLRIAENNNLFATIYGTKVALGSWMSIDRLVSQNLTFYHLILQRSCMSTGKCLQ